MNALRHGLLARCVVLEKESRNGFDDLLDGFIQRFGPVDDVELGLVEEMLAAFWRQRRAWAIETHTLDMAIADQSGDGDVTTSLTNAFASTARDKLDLIHRYETRLHRIFQRALHNLLLMRSPAMSSNQCELPNEPNPVFGQSDSGTLAEHTIEVTPVAQSETGSESEHCPQSPYDNLPNEPNPICEQ